MTTESTSRIELGFLTNGAFSADWPGGVGQGHKDVIELFRIGEQLGYDKGWVRNRHFDNYLSSPLTVLAAAAQATRRIRLGTAIIPVGYEHPIRLAEDAATVDLIADGRLELGIASGLPSFHRIFHPEEAGSWEETSKARVKQFLAALRGESYGSWPAGDDLHVRPLSPGLAARVWYGPSGVASATRAAEFGLDLLLSAIAPAIGLPFDAAQLAQIEAHQAAWTRTDRAPRVSTARLFFPWRNERQRQLYQGFADLRAAEGPAASRPPGALGPVDRPTKPGQAAPGLMSPVVVGEPAAIVDYLLGDLAVQRSGEFMIFLPPGFTHAENLELLETIVEHVAPHLGWRPVFG
jgi:alkanesulfonate monooxygenase SsuD/methylene tetrahydromethanopterin reductase-like flavin-dependent oxidoreductase (luciferase family)